MSLLKTRLTFYLFKIFFCIFVLSKLINFDFLRSENDIYFGIEAGGAQ